MSNETPKIYAERHGQWQELLRSGELVQGHRQLRSMKDEYTDTDRYCCLGVGCLTFERETGKGKWKGEGRQVEFSVGNGIKQKESAIMPPVVFEWYGLHLTDEEVYLITGKSSQSILYLCNDVLGMNFKKIAEIIDWLSEPEKNKSKLVNLLNQIVEISVER